MSDVAIREATPDDAAEVTRLLVDMKAHHRRLDPNNARFRVDRVTLTESVEGALGADDDVILVAEDRGRVVGFVKLRLTRRSWGKGCEVHSLMVEEGSRGRGVGSRLMEAAEERARLAGASGMRLDVSLFNDAAAEFYRRRGYEQIAVRLGKTLSA